MKLSYEIKAWESVFASNCTSEIGEFMVETRLIVMAYCGLQAMYASTSFL